MMRRDALVGQGDRSSPTIGQDRGWTTFVLSNYFRRNERNIEQCPETWRLVQRVPGLVSVMFSVLEPGARLPAHHGPYNGLLRLHLGLIVPEPREAVAIRIDGAVHHWEEGRALIFDDTFEHEARNESGHTRVVLFIDFERPLKFPARFVNRPLLRSYFFRPFVREGAEDQGLWARRFYREAQAMREEARATCRRGRGAARADGGAGVREGCHGAADARRSARARVADGPEAELAVVLEFHVASAARAASCPVERLAIADAAAHELRPVRNHRLRIGLSRGSSDQKLRMVPAQLVPGAVAMCANGLPQPSRCTRMAWRRRFTSSIQLIAVQAMKIFVHGVASVMEP